MLALVYIVVGLTLAPFIWTLCLYPGARFFRAPNARWKRLFLLATILGVVAVGLTIGFALAPQSLPMAAGFVAVYLLLNIYCLRHGLELSWPRAIGACLIFMVTSVVVFSAVLIPLRLYVIEAFQGPTNDMAPALIGEHFVSDCPHCGHALIVPSAQLAERFNNPSGNNPVPGICTECRRMSEALVARQAKVHGPDRFFVDKTLTPQRWDLLAYRAERNGKPIKCVHRLVGLPGERLDLKFGELRINGQPANYSPDMIGLSYRATQFGAASAYGLHEGETVTLGEDEYFVLGDFSEESSDSRDNGPISEQDFVGVVTLIHWPPQRFQVIR